MDEDQKELLIEFMQFEDDHGFYNTEFLKDFEYRIRVYNDYYFK